MNDYDLIIIGGGLAGGLAAYRCHQVAPDLRLLLIERGEAAGGNHTWSFHRTDVSAACFAWLEPFLEASWNGYRVAFPAYRRDFSTGYHSISSVRFQQVLGKALGERLWLSTEAVSISPSQVTVPGVGVLRASRVFDARGSLEVPGEPRGYQKFVGQDLLLQENHGLEAPVLMDVCVEQKEGFRFFYTLPWGPKRVLVEDTRYSNSSFVDIADFRKEIAGYATRKGWKVEKVEREEVGCLPIPLSGPKNLPSNGLGVRGGLFHPTTGYSLPDAAAVAEQLAQQASRGRFRSAMRWRFYCAAQVRKRWFYRFLNRMLFHGAEPQHRYQLLERFYRLPVRVIERFYACRLSAWDSAKILLWGKPPVPLARAAECFFDVRESHV